MICPNCGCDNREKTAVCLFCGVELPPWVDGEPPDNGPEKDPADVVIDSLAGPDGSPLAGDELINAIYSGDAPTVERTIRAGYPVNKVYPDSTTPLMHAAACGNFHACDFLIRKRARVNATTASGETALMLAAGAGFAELADFLIQKGAQVNLFTREHRTTLDYALASGNPVVAGLVKKRGEEQSAERKRTFFRNAVIFLVFAVTVLAVYSDEKTGGHGTLIRNRRLELYYQKPATSGEARALEEFLAADGWGEKKAATVQLQKKDDGTYIFRVCVGRSSVNDFKSVKAFRTVARKISSRVFDRAPVEVHFCDENLQTLRVIKAPGNLGKFMIRGKLELYYAEAVTAAEAEKLMDYLKKCDWGQTEQSVVLDRKKDGSYVFSMCVEEGTENNVIYSVIFNAMVREMSREAFDGEDVEIRLCDPNLETIKVFVQD